MNNDIKIALNALQNLYLNGLIPYPRVMNNFQNKPFFEIFPHPALPINELNKPFNLKKVKVNKKHSLIFLSILKVLKPSTIDRTAKKIDYYFDDNLNFLSKEKEDKLQKAIELFDEFIKKHEIKEATLIEMGNNFYSQKNKDTTKNNMSIFKLEDSYFYYKKRKEFKKNPYLFHFNKVNLDMNLIKSNPIEYMKFFTTEVKDINKINSFDLVSVPQKNITIDGEKNEL